ncbi:hypothetical protein [Aeromicrobium sp. Root495]|uniref:hypothetical protein n=1 Tax=Aeromicrobium sp. Root495 TaxID=1736550 RepID=UPI0009E9B3FD|nr:hypothetical protein [Aeromicrobium sp. Root495]
MEILELVVSPGHRYAGRPTDGVAPMGEGVDEAPTRVDVRAHRGIVGDRYFGARHRRAAVTFVSREELESVLVPLGVETVDTRLARRNVVLSGVDVESLLHTTFTIDAGHGPARFRSLTRANPCAWMDVVYAEGSHRGLRRHAGIRTEPLDDGVLEVGPVRLLDVVPLSPEELPRRRGRSVSAGA